MSLPLTQEQKKNWQFHIEAYFSSGLSLKAYARQEDLVYHQLVYHVRQSRKEQTTQVKPATFESVKVASSASHQKVEICLPTGVKLVIPSEINPQHLQKILSVVIA